MNDGKNKQNNTKLRNRDTTPLMPGIWQIPQAVNQQICYWGHYKAQFVSMKSARLLFSMCALLKKTSHVYTLGNSLTAVFNLLPCMLTYDNYMLHERLFDYKCLYSLTSLSMTYSISWSLWCDKLCNLNNAKVSFTIRGNHRLIKCIYNNPAWHTYI